MLGKRYVDVMRGQLDKLEGQLEHLSEVADRIAERLATGGALHIHDTGHLLNQELVNRAGGLMAMTPLQYSFSVHNPVSAKHAARPPLARRTCVSPSRTPPWMLARSEPRMCSSSVRCRAERRTSSIWR